MKKIIFLVITILLFASFTVSADPQVSFTATSVENKTVFSPNLNADVTHYKWSIIGKRDAYDYETGWIAYADRGDHISILDSGSYFVTIEGRNINTGLTSRFTNEVKVSVDEEYVEPIEEEIEEDIGSLIIHNLPEPLKTFFLRRSPFELLLIVLASLLILAVITRRKKINVYVKLERFYEK